MEKAIEIKRRAQRCVQNGDLDGALREYEKLVETPESDPYNFVLLADLLYKKGDQGRAAERYLKAVTAYEKASLFKNGIAVCKKMMRLSLSQAQVLRKLAELHALDGLTSEASVYFWQFAEHMLKANNTTEAATALRSAFDNGQENIKLLEQLADVLLLEGENAKAAETLREAAEHWKARAQAFDARRCLDRANLLDPNRPPTPPTTESDPFEAMPQLGEQPAPPQLPSRPESGSAPAFSTSAPELPKSAATPPASLSAPRGHVPGSVPPLAPAPPRLQPETFERSPRFVAPAEPGTAPTAAAHEAREEEEPEQDSGVRDHTSGAATTGEGARRPVDAGPPASWTSGLHPSSPLVPSPSTIARRPDGLVEGVAQVEGLLQRAQEEFRAGNRDRASQALVEAAVTYERLGRLDSAATIFRSLGRGAQSPLEVMELWLANCEKRGDRTEGSQVATELGDRSLNDGQEAQARAWFEHAVAIDSGNETARRRLQRLSGAVPSVLPPAAAANPPIEAGRVEVALGRGQAVTFDLAGLLQEFQRGVDTQLDGDAQGHYDLGMAYREMGLFSQAIESFRIAGRESRLVGRAHEMVGRCHADSGDHDEAVPEFEAALHRSTLDGAGEAELRYQLGLSLAELGDFAGAVHQLELADRRYPGRSDVVERLAKWRESFRRAA